MRQTQRWCWLVVMALFVGATPLSLRAQSDEPSAAGGEEVDEGSQNQVTIKTLAERIPAVTRRAFRKSGRVELTPSVGYALNDPFYTSLIPSLGISYHVLESLSVGLVGDFYGSFAGDVPVVGGTVKGPEFNRPVYGGRLEVAWAPLYGKVSLLAEKVLHLDTYLIVGGGVMGMKQGDPGFGAVFGLGQHYFFNRWMAVRIEVRDQIIRGAGRAGEKQDLQQYFSAQVGLSLFLPSDFEEEVL